MPFSDENFATLNCSNIDNTKVLLKYDTVLFQNYCTLVIIEMFLAPRIFSTFNNLDKYCCRSSHLIILEVNTCFNNLISSHILSDHACLKIIDQLQELGLICKMLG